MRDRAVRPRRGRPSRPGAALALRLTWAQALAWRLRRHHLVERAAPADLLRVVSEICGLHAQLMSSAELSAWARVDGLERNAVSDALWKRRRLVKLWGDARNAAPAPGGGARHLALRARHDHEPRDDGSLGHRRAHRRDRRRARWSRPHAGGARARGRGADGRRDARRVRPLQLGLVPQAGVVPGLSLLRPERRRPLRGSPRRPRSCAVGSSGPTRRTRCGRWRGASSPPTRPRPRRTLATGRVSAVRASRRCSPRSATRRSRSTWTATAHGRSPETSTRSPRPSRRLAPSSPPSTSGSSARRGTCSPLDPALKARVRPRASISPVILVKAACSASGKRRRKGCGLDVDGARSAGPLGPRAPRGRVRPPLPSSSWSARLQ